MANWANCPAVTLAGGLWVFQGTQTPLYALYETLASGGTVADFSVRYPAVGAGSAVAALQYEADAFREDLLIRPDGPGFIAPIPIIEPSGCEIPDWNACPAVERIAGKVSGAWIFTQSRLPLSALHENLSSGCTVAEFVDWYGADASKVVAVLEHEALGLMGDYIQYANIV